jgi:hypothetical protein
MKFLSRIILIFFISFQFSSTVISLINSDKGNKVVMNFFDENEDSKETEKSKEIKFEFIYTNTNDFSFFIKETTSKVSKPYLLKEYSTQSTQFLLPPELV